MCFFFGSLFKNPVIGFSYSNHKYIRFYKLCYFLYSQGIQEIRAKEHAMTDQIRKTETIRRIQRLQLSDSLIQGLDDAIQAESIVTAVQSLQCLSEHWN